MKSNSPRMNPFTLSFDSDLELKFRQEQLKHSTSILRTTILFLFALILLVYVVTAVGVWTNWLNKVPSVRDIAPLFFLPPLLILGYAITFSKNLTVFGDYLVSLIVLMLFTCVIWAMRGYPETHRLFAHGMIFVFLTVNTGLPYHWILKAITGFICIATFAAVAWHDQIYRIENFYQIHTQLFITLTTSVAIGYLLEKFVRFQYLLKLDLAEEKKRSDELLLNILPKAIADRMKNQSGPIVDSFANVSVMFADIVGFTPLAESMSPQEIVNLLNQLFSRFDASASLLKIEKIKTIGDAYMAVSGLPEPCENHAHQIAELALEFREAVIKYCAMTGHNIGIRIGINSGPVVAGVIGTKKFLYDLWGDTVNVANRMESHGIAGEIQITNATRQLLGNDYEYEDRGLISIKGRGEIQAWLLKKPRI
jgi:class 3 adenylate cyclase